MDRGDQARGLNELPHELDGVVALLAFDDDLEQLAQVRRQLCAVITIASWANASGRRNRVGRPQVSTYVVRFATSEFSRSNAWSSVERSDSNFWKTPRIGTVQLLVTR